MQGNSASTSRRWYCAFKKLLRPVGTGCPTGKGITECSDSQLSKAPNVLLARMSVQRKKGVHKSKLISFDLHVRGSGVSLHALLDTGATNNFISSRVLKYLKISPKSILTARVYRVYGSNLDPRIYPRFPTGRVNGLS